MFIINTKKGYNPPPTHTHIPVYTLGPRLRNSRDYLACQPRSKVLAEHAHADASRFWGVLCFLYSVIVLRGAYRIVPDETRGVSHSAGPLGVQCGGSFYDSEGLLGFYRCRLAALADPPLTAPPPLPREETVKRESCCLLKSVRGRAGRRILCPETLFFCCCNMQIWRFCERSKVEGASGVLPRRMDEGGLGGYTHTHTHQSIPHKYTFGWKVFFCNILSPE